MSVGEILTVEVENLIPAISMCPWNACKRAPPSRIDCTSLCGAGFSISLLSIASHRLALFATLVMSLESNKAVGMWTACRTRCEQDYHL